MFSKRSLAGSAFGDGSGSRGPSSPFGDRMFINDWKPPLPPTIASTLEEEVQLEAMEKQVAVLNEELEAHQALQAPMMELVRKVSCSKEPIINLCLVPAAQQQRYKGPPELEK
jgi:hypothetical protein